MAEHFGINIKVENKEIADYLRNAKTVTFGLVENLVGKVSKNSRGAAYEIEKMGAGLDLGEGSKYYWRNWKTKNPGYHTTDSYWDSTTKSFKTHGRKAKGGVADYGLENFKFFERPDSNNPHKTRAAARLTSNIANLFDKDVNFPKSSLPFSYDGGGSWSSYAKGDRRKGRNFFYKYKKMAEETMDKSQTEALTKWQEAISKGISR